MLLLPLWVHQGCLCHFVIVWQDLAMGYWRMGMLVLHLHDLQCLLKGTLQGVWHHYTQARCSLDHVQVSPMKLLNHRICYRISYSSYRQLMDCQISLWCFLPWACHTEVKNELAACELSPYLDDLFTMATRIKNRIREWQADKATRAPSFLQQHFWWPRRTCTNSWQPDLSVLSRGPLSLPLLIPLPSLDIPSDPGPTSHWTYICYWSPSISQPHRHPHSGGLIF